MVFVAVVGVGICSVDIELNARVVDLKKKIKEENPNEIRCEAELLKLYLAREGDKWLNCEDHDEMALEKGEIPDRIKNLMRDEQLMFGARTLNNDAYFGKTFEQVEGDIHVLVELPEGAKRDVTAATTPLTAEQVRMAMNKVLDERDRNRSLRRQLGLEYSSVVLREVVDDSICGYQWLALPEKHPDQRKAVMKYVEEHLGDALISEQKNFLKDVAGMHDLLDCDDRRSLPFKVKGTADLMLVDEVANQMNDVFVGLRFVIEVRKDRPSYEERWQVLLELAVADLKSESRCAPVGLLTNLNDYWYFLWFTPERKIARTVLKCPANAFQTMKEVLKETSGPTRDGHFPMRVAFMESPRPLKRQKLRPSPTGCDNAAAAEMLERYELMADQLDPKFLQQQRIAYAFELVKQMPIHSAMDTEMSSWKAHLNDGDHSRQPNDKFICRDSSLNWQPRSRSALSYSWYFTEQAILDLVTMSIAVKIFVKTAALVSAVDEDGSVELIQVDIELIEHVFQQRHALESYQSQK
ncbi:unnamed protein product [Aphanomyces euteiches]